MAVYLLHFVEPYKHAQHYLGFTDDSRHETDTAVDSRLAYHMRGAGSKLMRAVARAGIEVKIARVWPHGTRDFERTLKRRRYARSLCPICSPESAFRYGRSR